MRRWAIINVLLGIVVVLLAVQIVRTWARGLPPAEEPRAAPPEPAPPAREKRRGGGDKGSARAQQQPEALVAVIAEKDLFDPSRRAPSADEAKADTPRQTEPPPNVTVVGVRIVGKDHEVFVSEAAGSGAGGQRRLRVGDEVGGYTVKSVQPTAVTLASPSGDLVTMPLTIDKAKAGARPAATPVRAGQATGSPAAGSTARQSPAAGVGGRPGTATTATPAASAAAARASRQRQKTGQQLPAEVQQKLEQLKHNEGRRSGGKP